MRPAGTIDTIVVAFPDMQGRLLGKRLHPQFFLDHVLEDGTEGCNYLLALDVEMNTVDGYAISSWEKGYGDMRFDLDLASLPGLDTVQGLFGSLSDLASASVDDRIVVLMVYVYEIVN